MPQVSRAFYVSCEGRECSHPDNGRVPYFRCNGCGKIQCAPCLVGEGYRQATGFWGTIFNTARGECTHCPSHSFTTVYQPEM